MIPSLGPRHHRLVPKIQAFIPQKFLTAINRVWQSSEGGRKKLKVVFGGWVGTEAGSFDKFTEFSSNFKTTAFNRKIFINIFNFFSGSTVVP